MKQLGITPSLKDSNKQVAQKTEVKSIQNRICFCDKISYSKI